MTMGWHPRWQLSVRLGSENSQMNCFCHPRGYPEAKLGKFRWRKRCEKMAKLERKEEEMRTFHKFYSFHILFLIGIPHKFSMSILHLSDNHCQLFRWIQNWRGVNIVCSIYQAVLEDICDRLGLLRAQLPLCGHSLSHLLSIQNFCVKMLTHHILIWCTYYIFNVI